MGDGDDDGGGGEDSEDVYNGNAKPVLDSVLDLYLEDEIILVCDSRPFSSPAYMITDYLSTSYCPKGNVNDFDLRRPFYSKQVF